MNEVNVDYDPDTWIRVPLDYVDTRWHDAGRHRDRRPSGGVGDARRDP